MQTMPTLCFLLLLLVCAHAHETLFRVVCLDAHAPSSLTLTCPDPTSRLVLTRAQYVRGRFRRTPPTCSSTTPPLPDSRDLLCDVTTLVTSLCNGGATCRLPVERREWGSRLVDAYQAWLGTPYFTVTYTCLDHSAPAPVTPVTQPMLTSTTRSPDRSMVRVYGCATAEDQHVDLSCDRTVIGPIRIISAVLGKVASTESRCHSQDPFLTRTGSNSPSDVITPEVGSGLLRDLRINITQTARALCGDVSEFEDDFDALPRRSCRVGLSWESVKRVFEQLATGENLVYRGGVYLDVHYVCGDVPTIPDLPATQPPSPQDPLPRPSVNKPPSNGKETTWDDGSEEPRVPLTALGGVGIALLVMAAGGFILTARYIKKRRLYAADALKAPPRVDSDMYDPTYNPHISPARAVPTHTTIAYDYERHPSGVYDVPRLSSSTSAITPTAASPTQSGAYAHAYSVPVRVGQFSDDEDEVCSMCIAQGMTMGGRKQSALARSVSQFSAPGSKTGSVTSRKTCSYYDTLASVAPGGKVVKKVVDPVKRVGEPYLPPQLSPRCAGMPPTVVNNTHQEAQNVNNNELEGTNKSNAQATTYCKPETNQSSPHTTTPASQPTPAEPLTSKSPRPQVLPKPGTAQQLKKPKLDLSTAVVAKLPTTNHHDDHSKSKMAATTTPLVDEVFSTPTTESNASLLRRGLVSGAYDNNMENMPDSPYCYK